MGIRHYENFPVGSILLPANLRRPVALIYAFARSADDFADEGNRSPQERLALIDRYARQLDVIEAGRQPELPLFRELGIAIARYALPVSLFRDLLSAFSQDVTKRRYADFGEVMDYCRRSANPVGRLLLHLFDAATPQNIACGDAICSSLQLINFLQDVPIDYGKSRIYLPQDELARFGVSEAQIGRGEADGNWRALMSFQIERARRMLLAGAPLGRALPGRTGLELRMIMAGANRILAKLQRTGANVFRSRPVLKPLDWIHMLYRAAIAHG